MKVVVVYVSYRKDLGWLCYSLQFLFKNLRGDFKVVVRLDDDCRDVVKEWGVPAEYRFLTHRWPDGYAHAMYQKMIADDHADPDTDCIWLMDSDHMLIKPAHVDDFFENGLPILPYCEWNDADISRVARSKWGPPTERALQVPLDRDYMIGPPMNYWVDTFRNVRQRITKVRGMSFIDAVYSGVPFSAANFMSHVMTVCDYETLGLYAATFEAHRYALKPAIDSDQGWPFKVYWSHGGLTPEIQAELDDLLRDSPPPPG